MKSMKNVPNGVPGIQGDVAFTRISELPANVTVAKSINGFLVVAHSESGHNHAVAERQATMYDDPDNSLQGYLVVEASADVVHQKSYDTHETVNLDPGVYKVNRQREYTPEGLRAVAD